MLCRTVDKATQTDPCRTVSTLCQVKLKSLVNVNVAVSPIFCSFNIFCFFIGFHFYNQNIFQNGANFPFQTILIYRKGLHKLWLLRLKANIECIHIELHSQ